MAFVMNQIREGADNYSKQSDYIERASRPRVKSSTSSNTYVSSTITSKGVSTNQMQHRPKPPETPSSCDSSLRPCPISASHSPIHASPSLSPSSLRLPRPEYRKCLQIVPEILHAASVPGEVPGYLRLGVGWFHGVYYSGRARWTGEVRFFWGWL